MEKKEFHQKEFEIVDHYPYLDKKRVQLPAIVEIVDVLPTHRQNRPVFIGDFPFGKHKFDLCVEEMLAFMDIYGKIPQNWIGVRIEIKANPIKINKREGLRLSFTQVD